MRSTPRAVRMGIVAVLVMPAAAIMLTSGLQAQVRPPNPPPFPRPMPPPFQPPPQPFKPQFQPPPPPFQTKMPVIERVWTCNKCNKVIGNGAFPPGTCPSCGVRIINGIDPINPNPGFNPNPNPGFNPNPPINPNPNPNPDFNPNPINPNPPTNPTPAPNDTEPVKVNAEAPAPQEKRPQAAEARTSSNTGITIGILVVSGLLFVVGLAAMGTGAMMLVKRTS